jgi:hypothetical protein
MIVGTYSISHLLSMYKDPYQRPKLEKYIWLVVLSGIIWITAVALLVYYWYEMELWAQLFAISGLFFNAGGSLFSILVIYLGLKDTQIQPKSRIDSVLAMSPNTTLPSVTETISLPTVENIDNISLNVSKPITNTNITNITSDIPL